MPGPDASGASGAIALENDILRDFERIYREHGVYVLRVLRRLGLPRQQAEDLAQDVFESLFLNLGSLPNEDRRSLALMRAYLFRSAWNRFANYRRLHSVRNESVSARLPEASIGSPAHDYVLAREMARLLGSLGSRDVAVFVGFEVFGMTAPELARELCVDETEVRRVLEEARKALRQRIARHQEGS